MNTLILDFQFKVVKYKDKIIKLQIWDFADTYEDIISAVYRNAHGVLLCYDITNQQSLLNGIRKYNDESDKYGHHIVSKWIVGCKCDDVQSKICGWGAVSEVAVECGINDNHIIETSALREINVDKAFEDIAKDIVDTLNMRSKYPFYG